MAMAIATVVDEAKQENNISIPCLYRRKRLIGNAMPATVMPSTSTYPGRHRSTAPATLSSRPLTAPEPSTLPLGPAPFISFPAPPSPSSPLPTPPTRPARPMSPATLLISQIIRSQSKPPLPRTSVITLSSDLQLPLSLRSPAPPTPVQPPLPATRTSPPSSPLILGHPLPLSWPPPPPPTDMQPPVPTPRPSPSSSPPTILGHSLPLSWPPPAPPTAVQPPLPPTRPSPPNSPSIQGHPPPLVEPPQAPPTAVQPPLPPTRPSSPSSPHIMDPFPPYPIFPPMIPRRPALSLRRRYPVVNLPNSSISCKAARTYSRPRPRAYDSVTNLELRCYLTLMPFYCGYCYKLPENPVTNSCGHTSCQICLLKNYACSCGTEAPLDLGINILVQNLIDSVPYPTMEVVNPDYNTDVWMSKFINNSPHMNAPELNEPPAQNAPFAQIEPPSQNAPLAQFEPPSHNAPFAQFEPTSQNAPFAQIASTSQNAPFAQIASTAQDEPLAMIASPSQNAPLAEIASTSQNEPLTLIASPSQNAPLAEIASPSQNEPLTLIASPSQNAPLAKIASPSQNEPLTLIASPSQNAPLAEIASPSQNAPLEQIASTSQNEPLEQIASTSQNAPLALITPPAHIIERGFRSIAPELVREWFRKDELDCPLCTCPFIEPITTRCGHTFCRACLERTLDYNSVCPLCKVHMNWFDIDLIDETRFISGALNMCRRFTAAVPIETRLPIFPCTIAFPMVSCPLFVFKPQYRLMLRRCLDSTRRFGMVLPSIDNVDAAYGTVLEIKDCVRLPNGCSLVSTMGESRFRILDRVEIDGYDMARVTVLRDDEKRTFLAQKQHLQTITPLFMKWRAGLSQEDIEAIASTYGPMPSVDMWTKPDGSAFVWWALAFMPLADSVKYTLLGKKNSVQRMRVLQRSFLMMMRNMPRPIIRNIDVSIGSLNNMDYE